MAEVLIRDVPEAVLADIDAHAARLGLSRSVGVWRLMRLVRARRCLWTTCVPSPTGSPIWPTSRSWGRPGGDTSGWSTSPHWCALPPLLTAGSVRIGPSEAWSGHNGHRAGDRLLRS